MSRTRTFRVTGDVPVNDLAETLHFSWKPRRVGPAHCWCGRFAKFLGFRTACTGEIQTRLRCAKCGDVYVY